MSSSSSAAEVVAEEVNSPAVASVEEIAESVSLRSNCGNLYILSLPLNELSLHIF